MTYSLTFDKNLGLLDFDFGKHKAGVFVEFRPFDSQSVLKLKDRSAVVGLIDLKDRLNLEGLDPIARVEKECIKNHCVYVFSEGKYSPYPGFEMQVYITDGAGVVAFEWQKITTGITIGNPSLELIKQIEEVEVLVTSGALAQSAISELNPVMVVLYKGVEAYSKESGASEIVKQKKVKVNIKLDQRDMLGLKVIDIT